MHLTENVVEVKTISSFAALDQARNAVGAFSGAFAGASSFTFFGALQFLRRRWCKYCACLVTKVWMS